MYALVNADNSFKTSSQTLIEHRGFVISNVRLLTKEERTRFFVYDLIEVNTNQPKWAAGSTETIEIDHEAGTVTKTYTWTTRNVMTVKDDEKKKINQLTSQMLSSSDWYIIREAEKKIAIPKAIVDYRKSVRVLNASVISGIEAALTPEELTAALAVNWPAQPDVEGAVTLEELQDKRISDVDQRSIELMDMGFVYGGATFNLTQDQERWKELLLVAVAGMAQYPMAVYDMNKQGHSLANIQDVQGFMIAAISKRENILGVGRLLKQNIMAATTIDEVNTIIDNRS